MIIMLHKYQDYITSNITAKNECSLANGYITQPLLYNEWNISKLCFWPYKNEKNPWTPRTTNRNPIDLNHKWILLPLLQSKYWSLLIRHRENTQLKTKHTFYYLDTCEESIHDNNIKTKIKQTGLWNENDATTVDWTKIYVTSQQNLECGAHLLANTDVLLCLLHSNQFADIILYSYHFTNFSEDEYETISREWLKSTVEDANIKPFLSSQKDSMFTPIPRYLNRKF